MKCSGAAVFVLVLLQALGGEAFFQDGGFGGGFGGDPNAIDLTTILECAADGGGRLALPLTPPDGPEPPGFIDAPTEADPWLPPEADFAYPENLIWVPFNLEVLSELVKDLQGIDMSVQRIFETDMSGIINATGSCVQSVNNTMDSDDPLFITDTLIAQRVNGSGVPGLDFSRGNLDMNSDEFAALLFSFGGLQCRVINRWTDLGVTFVPRFLAAGRCYSRLCGVPVLNGQICRPDLSEDVIHRLPALRWDCCWELDTSEDSNPLNPFSFNCGWRKVTIPLLCDCDCSCPQRTQRRK